MKYLAFIFVLSVFASGGDNNLMKRFRPNKGRVTLEYKFEDLDKNTKWFAQAVKGYLSCPGEDFELYLYGSRAKDNWWFNSDFDFGITVKVDDDIRRVVRNCQDQFRVPVNIEVNRVYPETDKRLIRVK